MLLRDILRQNNLDLLREIKTLLNTLAYQKKLIPIELKHYYNWTLNYGKNIHNEVQQNLQYLELKQDIILTDILSRTQNITREFRRFNQLLTRPILRVRSEDRLCLKILQWLHLSHPQTKNTPLAVIDGEFASYPSFPAIYLIPLSIQQGLLYLPILFHEFGHILYVYHRSEMDDLVESLQEEIADLIEPSSQRNDLYAQKESLRRRLIVETWYEWTQEIFCDAVGLMIGGPAFLNAFSMYLQMSGRGAYHINLVDLECQTHPVTWLRIKLLTNRIKQMGDNLNAEKFEKTWHIIAATMGIQEDYYGYYEPDFWPIIQQTIDDMLIETEPYNFSEKEMNLRDQNTMFISPIHLLNQAWYEFHRNPEAYPRWEKSAINKFLKDAN